MEKRKRQNEKVEWSEKGEKVESEREIKSKNKRGVGEGKREKCGHGKSK